jgi:hypothetical protein
VIQKSKSLKYEPASELLLRRVRLKSTEARIDSYGGTSLMRNTPLLGPYSRTIPRVLWWSQVEGLFLMSEVPLYGGTFKTCSDRNGSSAVRPAVVNLTGKGDDFKLASNEVYCTNALLFLINIMLCSKLHYQKVSN